MLSVGNWPVIVPPVVTSTGVRVTVAESLIRDLGRVSVSGMTKE